MEFDNDTAELELDINAGEADLGFMILKMIYQYVYYVETNAKMKYATLKLFLMDLWVADQQELHVKIQIETLLDMN